MKSLIVFTSLFLALTGHAQNWHWGLKTDMNYSGVEGNGMQSKLTLNFQAGAFAEYKIFKRWSIQPELLFTQQTYKKSDDFLKYYNLTGRSGAQEKIYLNYVSIPLLVKYNFNKMLSLHFGPQYGFRVYANENLLKNNQDAFKKYELSMNAGIEASLSPISIYFRYNRGISDINAADDRYQWKSVHFQTGIAIKIR